MLIVVPVLVSLPIPDVMLCKNFKYDEFSKTLSQIFFLIIFSNFEYEETTI